MAPFRKSKKTDPAVLVMDEAGTFCISLLSGHLGGANDLCRLLSEALGACPVITTATDVNRRFAVDVFAKKNGMEISDMQLAKEVSARLLAGETVALSGDTGNTTGPHLHLELKYNGVRINPIYYIETS